MREAIISAPLPARTGPPVFKFGGTSVADATCIRHVAGLVAFQDPLPVVVVSAVGGVTDELMDLARSAEGGASSAHVVRAVAALRSRHLDILANLTAGEEEGSRTAERIETVLSRVSGLALHPGARSHAETRDGIAAAGEDLSVLLVALAIREAGRPAEVVDARDLIRTDERFGRARPQEDRIRGLARDRLTPLLARGRAPVVQGFVGATEDGRTTTLGRGGSDFSASLLGAALDSQRVHIWTDVDGIMSGDPRAVTAPRVLDDMGFEEAMELSYFGARVLHPDAAKYAVARGVPLHVRNTFRPGEPGTRILAHRRGSAHVAAVAFKPDVVLIKVRSGPAALPYGFLAEVFGVLTRHRLPVDLVATSHSSTAFTIDENEELDAVRRELAGFAEVELVRGMATITVVGQGLLDEPGVDGMVFQAVGSTPVRLVSQASDVSLSFVVSQAEAPDVVRRLHDRLIAREDGRDTRPAPPEPGPPADAGEPAP
ncbi:MAG TPA: aspartate kinase [Longimicrobiales bacterium]